MVNRILEIEHLLLDAEASMVEQTIDVSFTNDFAHHHRHGRFQRSPHSAESSPIYHHLVERQSLAHCVQKATTVYRDLRQFLDKLGHHDP